MVLVFSCLFVFSIIDPFHVLDVPWDVAAGKLHGELGDPLHVDLVGVGQLDGELTVRGRLVVEVREFGADSTLAHKVGD